MPALPKQAPKFAYQAPLGVELDSNGEQKMLKEHVRKASLGSVPHYSASWVRYSRLMRGRIPGLAGADSARFNTRLSNASYLDEQVNASHYVPSNIYTHLQLYESAPSRTSPSFIVLFYLASL